MAASSAGKKQGMPVAFDVSELLERKLEEERKAAVKKEQTKRNLEKVKYTLKVFQETMAEEGAENAKKLLMREPSADIEAAKADLTDRTPKRSPSLANVASLLVDANKLKEADNHERSEPLAMKPPPSSAEPAKDSPPSPAPVLGERSKSIVMDPRRRGSITSGAGGVAPVPSRSPGSSPGKRHLAAPEPGTLLGASSSSSSLSQPEGMQRSSLSPKDGHRASVPERPSIVYDSSDEDDASAAPAKGMGRRFSDTPSHPQHVSNTNTGISHARSTTTLSTLALPQSGPHPTPGLAVTPRRRGPDGFAPVIKIADADTQVVTTRLSPTRSDDRTVPFYTEYTEEEEEWTREREREREKERERAREREKEREFARLAEAQGSDRPSLAGLKSVKSSSDIKELKRSLMSDPNSDPLAAGPRPQTSRQTLGALPLGKLPSHNNLAALAEGNTTLAPLSSATKKPLAPLKLDALPLPSAGGLAAGPLSPTPLPPPPTSSSQVPPSSSPQSPRGSPLAEERVDPLPPPLQGRRPSLTGGSGPLPLPGLKRPGVL